GSTVAVRGGSAVSAARAPGSPRRGGTPEAFLEVCMRSIVMSAVGIFMLGATAQPAQAIPAFARKCRVSCSMCRSPAPRLNDFGERFANHGCEFAPGEAPRDTLTTGDPLLRLQSGLPLAVRLAAYITTLSRRANGQVVVDRKL